MNIFLFFFINHYIYNKYSQLTRSNIHAIYTFILSLGYFKLASINLNISNKNYLEMLNLSIFYCIYDIYYLKMNKINGYKSLIVHHSLIILALTISNIYLYNEDNILNLIALNYITEISTPFFNRSFTLVEQKKENSLEFLIINTIVVLLFGVSRVLFIPYYLYLSYKTNRKYVLLCQLLLGSMNTIWFYKIVKYYNKIIVKKLK